MTATHIEGSMPAIVTASDTASLRAQSRYHALTAVSLALLVVASVFGLIHGHWAGWVSAAAFAAALLINAIGLTSASRREWYDGRAASESAKSLAYKYAVGGDPLGVDVPDAPDALRRQLEELRAELEKLDADIRPTAPGDMAALDALRESPREARAEAYRVQRLLDQRDWYAKRARELRDRARWWKGAMLLFQALGIGGAVLKGIGETDLDWLALFATAAASFAAWIAVRDYDVTARAYDFAAHDLGDALERLDRDSADESTWSRFVADAESAISREHTMWLARRRGAQ